VSYHQHTQVLNRFTVAQVLLTEPIVSAVRKELRKLFPEVKIDHEQVSDLMNNEVLKREVFEGDKAKETQNKIKKILSKQARKAEKKSEKSESTAGPSVGEDIGAENA